MDRVLVIFLASTAVSAHLGHSESQPDSSIVNFLTEVQDVEQFQSVFIQDALESDFSAHLIRELSTFLAVPVVLFKDSDSFLVKTKFNSKLLALVRIDSPGDVKTLQKFLGNFRLMRTVRTIVLLQAPTQDDESLSELFNFCWANDVINALAILPDFPETATFYRYHHMPAFTIEAILWKPGHSQSDFFPDRMRDLHGLRLPIVFGGSEPKMIILRGKHGEPITGGYAGHLFRALAKKHNANISNPDINKSLSAQELVEVVLNRTFDISAATTYPDIPMDWYTYPYDSINWFLLLPIEPSIPIYKILMVIFTWETLLLTILIIVLLSALLEAAKNLIGLPTSHLNYVFNDNSLRGALGQSFLEIAYAPYHIRFIYLLICLIGILLVTSYNAFLQTFMTSPPSEKKIESFDDLMASGMKVYSLKSEYDFLIQVMPAFKTKYASMFLFEHDFAKYVKFRDSMNTKYAYMVNDVKWVIYQEQQKIFTRPLFRHPKGMTFWNGIPMTFPINENSIYKDILNFLILETYSSGLLDYWQRRAFHELIEVGMLKLIDLTSKPEVVALKVEDLKLIWAAVGVAYLLAALCFVGELVVFKLKMRRR